ncbi:MAG TPA: ABC transporter substrate-binding protein [Dongiaceae bacterium]|jgi:putative spermidine/putrescine transport system substrate-binding protein|nr:ABC transporter substrate-binding protein [Dongiaceae bacterium]
MQTKIMAAVLAAYAGFAMSAALADPIKKLGQGEGEVDIIAWAGYVERGDSDKNYDWVTGFEKQTGCKVKVKTAATSDEMVSLMNGGGFDLVTASGDASLRLVAGDTVQEINTDLIPSYGTIDERLQKAPWHTVNGKHYGVPYQWGPNVLLYNATVFKDPPKSWSVVFEEQTLPDGKSNKGRIQAYFGAIYIADAALYLMKHRPELGITDPYALDQKQFDAAVDLLKEQRKLVQKYWSDASAQVDDFTTEGVVASTSWPYQVNTLQMAGKVKVSSVIPEEGATGWADTTMMHAKAPHPNCAYMWIEHSLAKDTQAAVASWFGSVPVVPAACKGNALLTDTGCETNGINHFADLKFWRTPTRECGAGRQCVPYKDWVAAYQAIQSSTP